MPAFKPAFLVLCLFLPLHAQPRHPNYDDDIRPLFARRCFGCHNASEMRSGLSLESYAGVMKGGGSGDAVIAGRPTSSLLYKAVMRDEGAPQMPLGLPKLPDAELGLIREWIAGGLPENANSQPKGPVAPSLDYHPTDLNRPAGPPAMPDALPPLNLPEPARANPVTALAASPWAPLIAFAGHERIYLYNLETRAPAGELPFPEGIPYSLRFSRNGDMLLAAGGRGVQSGKAVLYDVRTGKRLAAVGDERDIVLAADVSPDAKWIALGGPGKVVRVFSVADGKLLYELKKHTDWITALEFSPDGSHLATGDRSGGILLWDAANGGTAGNFAEHKDSITALSWRGDSQLLASSSEDGQIIVWNTADGFPVTSIAKAHTGKTGPGGVLDVQFANDGLLYSVGRDSALRVWSADGKRKRSATADCLLTRVAASADGKLGIAGDYQGRIAVWSAAGAAFTIAPPYRASTAPPSPAKSLSGPRPD
jgi:Planctomycete cytochrome C/WD domain, G-beta repeat